ncbi:MAG: hypothetical protein ACE363_08500 [Alphaproteobacteria bacterium]
MKRLALTALFALALPMNAVMAFQVIGTEQMDEAGFNLSDQGYFSQYSAQNDAQAGLHFSGGLRRSDGINYYGRSDSGSGRFFGDRSSTYKGCASGTSNVSQLNAMGGTGFAYPCQRFR